MSLPVEQATTATSRVLLPSFSRVQGDPGRFASSVVTVMGLLSLVVAVPTALLAAAAPTLVPWLLGDGWDTAATVVPIVGAANALALLTHTPAVAAEARGAIQRKLALQVLTLATTVGFLGVVVWTGPSLPRVAAAWAFGELARSVFYWVGMFGHLGLDRTAIAHRYLVTGVLAATAAAPVALVVRVLAIPGFWPMALSGAVALLGGTLLVLSPVGRVIRYDIRSVRSRASAPSAADVRPAPSAEPAVAPSADSPLVRAAESLDVAS